MSWMLSSCGVRITSGRLIGSIADKLESLVNVVSLGLQRQVNENPSVQEFQKNSQALRVIQSCASSTAEAIRMSTRLNLLLYTADREAD